MDKDVKKELLDNLEAMRETNFSLREMFKNFVDNSNETVSSLKDQISPLANVTAANPAGQVVKGNQLNDLISQANPTGNILNSTRAQYRAPWRKNIEDIEDILRDSFPKLADSLKSVMAPKEVKLDRKTKEFSFLEELLKVAAGLAALWYALSQNTQFTGALKIIGKWLVLSPLRAAEAMGKGIFKIAELAVKLLPESLAKYLDEILVGLKAFAKEPIKVLQGVFEAGGLGKTLAKWAGTIFGGAAGLAFRAIPVIGSLIDFGFAYHRFKKGDYLGGLIDLAAGIIGLEPTVGTWISLGLNVLNMILDFTGGGVEGRAKAQESIDFGAIIKRLGIESLKIMLLNTPIGWAVALWDGFKVLLNGGSIGDAFYAMAEWIPFFKPIAEFFGFKSTPEELLSTGGAVDALNQGFNSIMDFLIYRPYKWTVSQFKSVWTATSKFFKKYFIEMPGKMYDAAKDALQSVIDNIGKAFTTFKDRALHYISFGYAGESAAEHLERTTIGKSPGPIKDVVEAIGQSFDTASKRSQKYLQEEVAGKTWGKGFFSKAFDFILSPVRFVMDFVGDYLIKGLHKIIDLLHERPIPVVLADYSRSLTDYRRQLEAEDTIAADKVTDIFDGMYKNQQKVSKYFVGPESKFLADLKAGVKNINLAEDMHINKMVVDVDIDGVIAAVNTTNTILTDTINKTLGDIREGISNIQVGGAPGLVPVPGGEGSGTPPSDPVSRDGNPN